MMHQKAWHSITLLAAAATVGAVMLTGMTSAASAAASAGPARSAPAPEVRGSWGAAREVPGTAALNQGGGAGTGSVSCAAAGDCAAGGSYTDSSGHTQAFVVSEVNGHWKTAIEVPGTAALSQGGTAEVTSVSCASAGDCSAGGDYSGAAGQQAFVASEVNGHWKTAIEVPGTAGLNKAGVAYVYSVSCAPAGDCGAVGYYTDSSGDGRPFVASGARGVWGKAIEVPGIASLTQDFADSTATSVSCASAGDCTAGGVATKGDIQQVFVVSEVGGTWGKAAELPGSVALNQGGDADITAVSCAWADHCSAGGWYLDSAGDYQAFVASQSHGSWGAAIEVPGTPALNAGADGPASSLSCSPAGDCGMGGSYKDSAGATQAWVDTRP